MNQFVSIFFPPTSHGGHVHACDGRLLVYADIASSVEAHEVWQTALDALRASVERIHFESGAQFEECVQETLIDPMSQQITSSVCVLLQADALYASTFGGGELYVGRRDNVVPLLIKPTYAVGRALVGDVFLLTSAQSTQAMTIQPWRSIMTDLQGQVVEDVDHIQQQLHTLATQGVHVRAIVARINFSQSSDSVLPQAQPIASIAAPAPVQRSSIAQRLREKLQFVPSMIPKKRGLMMVLIIALVGILAAGVWQQVKRQGQSKQSEKIAVVSDYVQQQIELARSVSSINNARARTLLQDASQSIAELEASLGANNPDVKALREELKKSQAQITNDKRQASEYFDLAVEQKNARGTLMSQDGSTVAILDPAGYVYVLDLESKSIDRRRLDNAAEAVSLSVADDDVYVLIPARGVAQLSSAGESKKVISRSSEWRRPTQIIAYGSNLYILDPSANQIFRYGVTEKGYESSDYFRSDVDLDGAISMAIDGSVYVGFSKSIVKYTSGLQDGFNPQYGTDTITIGGLVTGSELDGLYVWDKSRGQVQVLGKNGAFKQQASNDMLSRASAVAVFNTSIVALVDSKLYKIDIVQ